MFTGIIQAIGRVEKNERGGGSGKIAVSSDLDLSCFKPGESIAVNGVCLTVTGLERNTFTADLSRETLNLTTLGHLERGCSVNLEAPLRPVDFLGGHIVTGHIDCIGTITKRNPVGEGVLMGFDVPSEITKHIVSKGSVTIDGISLTVVTPMDNHFDVALIPHTIKKTTLSLKKEGDKVNIETDILGKYVDRILKTGSKEGKCFDERFLMENGF